jgi:CRP/FNR family cyclic AMP-dependent transcriptional regulator
MGNNRPTQQFIKGQTILLEGAPGDRSFLILSGEVVICKKSEQGDLVPIAKLGAGEMFGEMYLFDAGKSRTASAIALTSDVNLEVIFQDELQSMLGNLHPAVNRIFQGLSMRLQKISGKYVQAASQKSFSQLPDGTLKPGGSYIHKPME